ncbi:DUF1993 domain-containing protein [Caenimonas soli]|uniref:DUF1993 domain-containing protein n=1 Tax=Caenimonas soli TaxID=2735555 RepID=UPI0015578346|nr:DUF1993 domain-containing protein [Caenimonas soli]NPC59158.1 DUF1993 domain-containing protein [Caenimonas soli]
MARQGTSTLPCPRHQNVERWLDKAQAHSLAQGIKMSALLHAQLAPDMRDFIYQIQSACDYTKAGAAWLSGQRPPRHEDNEQTLEEIRARIRRTVKFAESVQPAQYAEADRQQVSMSGAPGKVLVGRDYLLQMVLPNVYFHAGMAYAILRHKGVDVGKMDFLGPVNFVDKS